MSLSSTSSVFVGRAAELAQIGTLLADPACRLLTLVGTGGIGKTRLALEAARQFTPPDAHFFIPLQPLTSPDFIVTAIAEALRYQFYGGDPKQQLSNYLRDKAWLLVLDNFEHLLDGAPLLSDIIAVAPAVRLLVTSREQLNLVEEWVLEIGGLPYPDPDNPHVAEYGALDLFVQQAERAKVGFALSAANRAAVLRICRLVGGMPLGIELAAAWVRALSPDAIADEIARSLDILETPARNVEPRHRTMRAAIEPTWARLSQSERDAFMRLSVFRGGFTREAAEQVAGASLRTLSALVDKSLLRLDERGRYDLHELLRQYAAEKLLDAGEAEASADGHLAYYLHMAEAAEEYNFGREQVAWYDRLENDFDNLRAALARCIETETGLRLTAALGWFFSERAYMNEGLRWLERALAANPNAPIQRRAKALVTAGSLTGNMGDDPHATAFCQQGLVLAYESGDLRTTAWALCHLGTFGDVHEPAQAAALLQESLALFRAIEDAMGISHTLVRWAWRAVSDNQDYQHAHALLEEAALVAREWGDKIMSGWVAYTLGAIAYLHDHNLQQAKSLLESSIVYFREARFALNISLFMLACVEQALGNLDRAQTLFSEGLVMRGEIVANYDLLVAGLASVATARGQFKRAAILFGNVNEDSLRYGGVFLQAFNYDSDIAAARAGLGETAFEEAWALGSTMSRLQIIDFILRGTMTAPEVSSLPAVPASAKPAASVFAPVPLSARELEILRRVAEGDTNAEIAARLFLATSTVKWYVHAILEKLEATSRTQAVMRARTLGLLR